MIDQFNSLLANPSTEFAARTLATLISVDALELRVAERRDRRGIYHEKIGLFSDTLGNIVSFKGSTNETWSGWHRNGNFESIEVFCSWRGGLEEKRVARHDLHFDSLWSMNDPDIEVVTFPASATEYFKRYAAKGLDELQRDMPPQVKQVRSPLPHQVSAIAAWEAQNRRGIFEHATGSGKTFTAIIALQKHAALGLPALVLVPSRLLLEQWADEIRDAIPEAALLLAGGGHDRWKASFRLSSMTDPDAELGPRIVLATMQTASLDSFRTNVRGGSHLLIVADEVHQIGSSENSKIFLLDSGSRLGLSATPNRFGDPEGTAKIYDYFGGVVPPSITLLDAVKAGRLVPYEYFPHPINLSSAEADDWKSVTKLIQQEMARQKQDANGHRKLSEKARMLLIKRSRIAKKANAKVALAATVLRTHFEEGQSWLVYCEDGGQLADVLISLREAGLTPVEYHSGMAGDRDATMAWFRTYGGIMVSIRCLDEGVDIPAVSHALILASSQNPRQFIQRRGRVLRQAPGKHIAVIHDAIVVPVSLNSEPEQTSLLRAEIARSLEFADHALNRSGGAEIRQIAIALGISSEMLPSVGEEEDD
jgi:superfamily II DNA or RNA helicase